MRNLLQKEWIKSLMLAILIIGIAAVAFGVFSFFNTQYQIGQNLAYQVQNDQVNINTENPTNAEGMMLMSADLALHELQSEMSRAIIIGGAGLILIAIGWIGRETVRSRKVTSTETAAQT